MMELNLVKKSEVSKKFQSFLQMEKHQIINPKGKHINFNQGEKIKGEYLLDGSPAPHDILRILELKNSQNILFRKSKRFTGFKV